MIRKARLLRGRKEGANQAPPSSATGSRPFNAFGVGRAIGMREGDGAACEEKRKERGEE